jgi:xanthine/CO dehydrogenase XdhC/CoxF family maturation factor
MQSAQEQFDLSRKDERADVLHRSGKMFVRILAMFFIVSLLMGIFADAALGVAAINITESGGSVNVSESGTTDTYTIALNDSPSNNVTITITPDSQTDVGSGAGVATTITFTNGNWNVARTITVTAVNDSVAEGPHTSRITHFVYTSDWEYNGVAAPDVVAHITDNDLADVTITESAGSTLVNEAGPTSDTYTIVLNTKPSADVAITVTPDDQVNLGSGAGVARTFTFTTANWNTVQTVTVTAVDDAVVEGSHLSSLTHTASSTDPFYNNITIESISVGITDNDLEPDVSVILRETGDSTAVTESGPSSDTYTIVLDYQPTANVVITIDPDTQTNLGSGTGVAVTRTFTTANWDTPQTITVTAVDDTTAEGTHLSTITHSVASTDTRYNGLAVSNITSIVLDNDVAGATVVQSGNSTDISEAGPTSDSYTVVLKTRPYANVTVTVTPDSQVNLGAGAGTAVTLTFTTANWSTPQTVTVTAVDDTTAEETHISTLIHSFSSTDPNYNGLAISNLLVHITDNDTAGVTVAQSDNSTDISEAGPTSDTYTVVLSARPESNVTITVSPDIQTNLGSGAGTAVTLTFTTANWNTPQTITVTAVNDTTAEGTHNSTISHTVSSTDAKYNGLVVLNVIANITDNDIAGVTITQSGGSTNISEAGPTSDTYTMVLNTQPVSDVTVTVKPDVQTNLGAGAGTAVTLTFTTANWNTPQTITVTAVNDTAAESAHTSTITHSLSSIDPNYNGLAIANVLAQITDNDIAGVTITQSGGSTNINETGPTNDTYTVVLNIQPASNVAVTITPDAQTNLGSGAGTAITVTFTTGNWNTPQTVTVTAVDDTAAEGNHTSTIIHTLSSTDTNYNGLAVPNVVAQIIDNDVAGVTITPSGGSTSIDEEGPTSDTYTIVLNVRPTSDVVATVKPDAQTDLGSGAGIAVTLTFTPVNWNTPQSVTVTAIDDAVAENEHTSTITHSLSSVDPDYNGLTVGNVVAQITDNDIAGATITQSAGSTNVSEAGSSSDSYTFVLKTRPTSNVVVTVKPDAQTSLGFGAGTPITLTFTSANWNTPQTIIVTAIDDSAAEGVHTSSITHSFSSTDTNYNNITIQNVVAQVTDNDVAGVTITQSGGSTNVNEAGPTDDTYTVVLNTPPTSNVSVTVTPDAQIDLGSGAGTAVTLTFTSGNWNSAQTLTVTAVDDTAAEGTHTSNLTHSASSVDSNYNGLSVSNIIVRITDNDVAGVTITETAGSTEVSETGPSSDTYNVVLNTPPQAPVTITVTPDVQTDLGAGAGTAVTLLFTTANWNTPQTLTVTAVDDLQAEGMHVSNITHTTASTDPGYNGVSIRTVTVGVTDNDMAGVTITETDSSTDVNETGPTFDTYEVVLNAPPSANVVITLVPDVQTDLGAGQGTFITRTFTTLNWNTPQTITVTAVDDNDPEGPHTSTITHSASSTDANYNGRTIRNTVVHIVDNDVAGVTLTESGLTTSVAEAGETSDTYNVVLNRPPTADVAVTITPDAQVDLGGGPATAVTLNFTTANWSTPQTITVNAVDDSVAEGQKVSIITHGVSSADPNYNTATVRNISVTVVDDDVVGVTIVELGGVTNINEAGETSDTYSVVLNTQPTSSVTLTLTPDNQTDLGYGDGTPITLTFTTANWNTSQIVTVTAVDDAVAEGAHVSRIHHATVATDPNYNGIKIPDIVVLITDNDTLGVTVTESGNLTSISEAGTTSDTYTVVLNTRPSADVTITITPDRQTDLGNGSSTAIDLVFTPGNWNTAQTVTVTAVDDLDAEGAHISTITHYATSLDPAYSGLAVRNVTAYIADNDIAGVTITESLNSTDVSEDGPSSDTYQVVLNTPPTLATVTITVDPDNQTSVGAGAGVPVTLTFTSANWSTPQIITVTAVDDAVAEGPHSSTITHTAASTDPNYNGIVISTIKVNVTDDDSASVLISEPGGSTLINEEGPTSDTYTIVLSIAPASDVTITVDPDIQSDIGPGQGSPINLTFTTANWNVPQTVTVTAIDDTAAEGSHTSVITHTATSADPNYNGISIRNVTASVIDNDTAGVTITQTAGSTQVSETGPTSDTYSVVLDIPPTSNIAITVDPDDQTDLGAGPGNSIVLTFTTANWNTPQTVTVVAVDDETAESAHHAATITHTAASADPNYNRITINSVSVTVTDNDTAGVAVIQSGDSTDLAEAGPTFDTYTLVLDTPPAAEVTIILMPDRQADLGAGPGRSIQQVFTTANWNTPRTITVTAVDDLLAEGAHYAFISHFAASSDPNYNGIVIAPVVANVTDNDIAGVALAESGGATNLNETGNSPDTYTVVLTSPPTANVTFTAWPDQQCSLGAGAGKSISLIFTPANWNVPQTITATAIDDIVAEGNHHSIIAHTVVSTDSNYNNVSIRTLTTDITDNDIAGVTISESTGTTTASEDGATDTYTMVLNTPPTVNVILTITPDKQCNLGSGQSKSILMTFTPDNWDVPQTINVTAVDDAFAEGRHASTLTHIAASADPAYNCLSVRNVTVTIDDNDTSGISFIETDGNTHVDEVGTIVDSYQIVLNTPLSGRVTIVATPHSSLDLGAGPGIPVTQTFTPADWNVPQTIFVRAFDNVIPQGSHTAEITHTAFSSDGSYNWNNVGTVTVQIDDDDEGEPNPCGFMGFFMIAGLFLMSLMFAVTPKKS